MEFDAELLKKREQLYELGVNPYPYSFAKTHDIREIRALRTTGLPHKAIATRFGVDRKTISAILRNQTWRHVT